MFHGFVPKEGRVSFQWTDYSLLASAAAYRIVILLVLCTTFVPDEYFQYVEPSFAVLSKQGIRYKRAFISWRNNFDLTDSFHQHLGMGK